MNSPRHTVHFGHVLRSRKRCCAATVIRAACLTVVLTVMVAALTSLSAVAHGGDNAMSLTISSPAFPNGEDIPRKFTCEGPDTSPQLTWSEPPGGTKYFALLVDDPDAPVGNWNHWAIWNIPAGARGLAEGVKKLAQLPDGSAQGTNDFHKVGYNGPCPPAGKPHRYFFKLFALDAKIDLPATAGKKELEAAMKGHVLAQAEWMGRFHR